MLEGVDISYICVTYYYTLCIFKLNETLLDKMAEALQVELKLF